MKLVNHTQYDTTALRRLVQAVYAVHRNTEGPHNRWEHMVVTVKSSKSDRYSGLASIGVRHHGTVVVRHGTRILLRLPKHERVLRAPSTRVDGPGPCTACGEAFNNRFHSHDATGGVVVYWFHQCAAKPKHKRVAGRQASVRTTAVLIEHELRHSYGERHRRGHSCMGSQWDPSHEEVQAWTDGMFPGDVIPLAAPKATPVRDLQSERYTRTLELEEAWTSKLKRAQTALKKLRQRKRYYESAMAAKKGTTT